MAGYAAKFSAALERQTQNADISQAESHLAIGKRRTSQQSWIEEWPDA